MKSSLLQILFSTIFLLALSSCGSDNKKKSSKNENQPAVTDDDLSPAENTPEKIVYINSLEISDFDFSIEVTYSIDEKTKNYTEIVKVQNQGSINYYSFDYNYSQLMPESYSVGNDENFYNNLDASISFSSVSEVLESGFNKRFKEEIDESEYLTKKAQIISGENTKVDEKRIKACLDKILSKRQMLKNYMQRSFMSCRSSKYYEESFDLAKQFYEQNTLVSYKSLFGLMNIAPRINTFLEIDVLQNKVLSIGSAVSPDKPLNYMFQPSNVEPIGYCPAEVIFNPSYKFSIKKPAFVNSSAEPKGIDFDHFVNLCVEVKRTYSFEIKEIITEEFPGSSEQFRDALRQSSVYGPVFVKAIDDFAAAKLDRELDKALNVKKENESAFMANLRIFQEDTVLNYNFGYTFGYDFAVEKGLSSFKHHAFLDGNLSEPVDENYFNNISRDFEELKIKEVE